MPDLATNCPFTRVVNVPSALKLISQWPSASSFVNIPIGNCPEERAVGEGVSVGIAAVGVETVFVGIGVRTDVSVAEGTTITGARVSG